jgi:predicted SnoaL-like aldol condensation-catalyzing enzyme
MDAQAMQNAAREFLALVAEGDVDTAWTRHVGPGLRHHNGWFPADADALKNAMADNARLNPGKTLQVHQLLADGDRVAALSEVHHAPGDAGFAVVHIFRFEHGKIVELWDLAQEIPQPAVNGNGMF